MGLTGDAGKALRGEDDEWIREGLSEHGGHVRMHAGRTGLWGRGTVWAAGVSQVDSNACAVPHRADERERCAIEMPLTRRRS